MPQNPDREDSPVTRATGVWSRGDRGWLLLLAVLAAVLWLRDRSWMGAAADVLPILAAFPLFWWCGRPWRWRSGGTGVEWQWLTVAVALWVVGMALNLTVVMALGWTLAVWSLLGGRLAPEAAGPVARLLPLLWLGFPWLALEGDRIGWWFRLSAAGVAEVLFSGLGFDVSRQGVLVLVQGLPISVDAECSGLNVLQGMLLAGLVVAHRHFGRSRGFWWALPVLAVAAWCANTLRVLLVSVLALSLGPEIASGPLHVWGGILVLVLMFALCLAAFSALHRLLGEGGSGDSGRRDFRVGLAALVFGLLMCGDLPPAWRSSPFDRHGYMVLALWFLPVIVALASPGKRAVPVAGRTVSLTYSGAALVMVMLGSVTSLNVLQHAALALAAAAFLPPSGWRTAWLVLAVAWMPALGWVAAGAGVGGVQTLRFVLGLAALGVGVHAARRTPGEASGPVYPPGRRWRPWILGGAVAITLVWELAPLPDASIRLEQLPREGLGFASTEVALSPVEAGVYREARIVKRFYCVGHDRLVIAVIDGSRNRHAVHDPAYCFRGGGWRVAAEHSFALPGGSARQVLLQRGGEQREALYWFTDGALRHYSALRYWWQTAFRRLTFGAGGGEPVLVVVQPEGAVEWDDLFRRLPDLLTL